MSFVKAIESRLAHEEYLLPELNYDDLVQVDYRTEVPTTASMSITDDPSKYFDLLVNAYRAIGQNESDAINRATIDHFHELGHAETVYPLGLKTLFSVTKRKDGPQVQTFVYADSRGMAIPKIALVAFAARPYDIRDGLSTDEEYLKWMGVDGILGAGKLISAHNHDADEHNTLLLPRTYNVANSTVEYAPDEESLLLRIKAIKKAA